MIRITHTWICAACGAEESKTHQHYLGYELLRPYPPEGWVVVDYCAYCPKHKVIIKTIREDLVKV